MKLELMKCPKCDCDIVQVKTDDTGKVVVCKNCGLEIERLNFEED